MDTDSEPLRVALDLDRALSDEMLEPILAQLVDASGGKAGLLTTWDDQRRPHTSVYGLHSQTARALSELLEKALPQTGGSEAVARVAQDALNQTLRSELGPLHVVAVPVRVQGRSQGFFCVLHPEGAPRFLQESPGLYNLRIDRVELVVPNARLLQWLLQEHRWLDAVIRHSTDGVVIFDREGRVVGFNRAMEALSGWALEEAVGRPGHEIFPLKLGDGSGRSLALHQPGGTPVPEVATPQEGILYARDGSPLDVEVSGVAVRDEAGRPLGWVMTVRDIRRRKETERLGKIFLSAVSHELQTPIAIIKGFSGLLGDPEVTLSPEQAREKARVIHAESQRLERMVRQMLYATSIQAGGIPLSREAVSVPDLLERVARKMEPLARQAGGGLSVTVAPGLPPLWADEDKIEQVLTNLVENALKYAPGSQVLLEASGGPAEVTLSVSDQGRGVAPGERERIFGLFQRGEKPGARGTGLGLFICKAIVEAHGGRIGVDTPAGGGARFYFTVPGIRE
ncbi:MAG TPA: ATP-binding protein [Candidatus Nitrosotenuis sp.]|jgi:PAS domain S-box-containing protein|nr:ATP-binding protein [Candidatus Nitrosotenuis sp.]